MASGIDNATGVQFASGQAYYDHWLTNFFLDLYADARNNSSVWWNQVRKVGHTPTTGRFIIWPVRTTRNTGRNSIRPGGLLPDPGSQGGKTYSMETRTMMARVKIDGETLRRGKTNGGAFVTAEDLEIDGQLDDIQIENNRQAHNDGSGRMAELSGWTGTTLTLRLNQSIESPGTCTTKPVLYLEVGDRIGFYLPGGAGTETIRSTTAGQEGVYVRSILTDSTIEVALTPGGAAVNVSAYTVAPAAGDWIVRLSQEDVTVSSGKDTGAQNEMMGLAGIFSDAGVLDGQGASGSQQSGANAFGNATQTNFQGIPCTASEAFNRAIVLDNSGSARPLTEDLMQQAFSDAEELNNANIELMLSAYKTYNSYVKLLTPDKRYNDTLDLKGGHKLLTFNGVPWYKDRYAYGNRIYMIAMDQFQYFETQALQTLDPFNLGRWERLKDYDAYWTGQVQSGNLGVMVRQRVGALLTDLSL